MKAKLTKPPMGWNSWDCYGASVTEEEVRRNAEYMAKNLKEFGWEYVVVDIQWFEPNAKSADYNKNASLIMDEYSRLMPAVNRFPSAEGGKGFKPLADYVHSLGLKFGIHILRGIPKQAVRQNTKILGTTHTAAEIADFGSVCDWNGDMCGVDMSRDGAQEYYNSIIKMYAERGVDFIKVDDIARPYHKAEIEGVQNAIQASGRDIILSLSPGEAPLKEAKHLNEYAHMWRMTDDFWDGWEQLKKMFDYCRNWFPYVCDGGYPDCDMLPLGRIGIRSHGGDRMTNFTRDEQRMMMTLWSMFRSPLMFGGDMVYNDEFTLSLMTNKTIIEIDQNGYAGREVYRKGNEIVWAANGKDGKYYVAQFNIGEEEITAKTDLAFVGIMPNENVKITEVWENKKAELNDNTIISTVPPHGVKLFEIVL